MKWMVEWLPDTEQALAQIWITYPHRQDLTDAANAIDKMLKNNPMSAGESRVGMTRVLILQPIAVEYDVIVDDSKVVVWNVWYCGPSSTGR